MVAPEGKYLYRNTNGMVGGVCCGIAEYFDFDVALVRLMFIVLTVLSAGVFIFIYLAVWLILPAKPSQENTFDVDPTAFRSEVYEQVVNGGASPQASNVYTAIPPVPPAAASAYYQSTAHAAYSASAARANATAQAARSRAAQPKVVSSASRPFTTGLAIGIVIISVGLIALSSALGLFTVDANAWITHAGPFLLITVGLFIMGRASKSNILILCAGLALVAFVAVGAYFSLHEGPLELGSSLPFNPDSFLEWEWE